LRNAFVSTLLEEALKDKNIVLVTGDLGFQLFDDFASQIPNQFINAGITEQSMMSMAAGIASTGKRVFVYSIANFSTLRCLEQIRNDVCYMDKSVVIVSVGAGFSYGSLGYSHHATEDIAIMRSLPNMDVISPSDKYEAEAITRMLVRTSKPSYLRLGKAGEPVLHESIPSLEYGKFVRLSEGKNGYIFFTGSVGLLAIQARERLLQQGKEVEVLSVPFISNLDENYIRKMNPESPVVILEEHGSRGGLGSAFLEKCNDLKVNLKITRVTASQNEISLTGSQDFLRLENGITVDSILKGF
jgi:transketolase